MPRGGSRKPGDKSRKFHIWGTEGAEQKPRRRSSRVQEEEARLRQVQLELRARSKAARRAGLPPIPPAPPEE